MAVNDLAEKNRENPVEKRIKTMVSAPNRDVKNPRIKTVITKADPRKVKGLLETSDLTAKEKAPESLRDYILKIHSAPISSRRDFRYALTQVKEFTGYSGKKYKIIKELD